MILHFKLKNSEICFMDKGKIVATKSRNKEFAQFELLSDDWVAPITAIFESADGQAYTQILDENNECVIPWEALQFEGYMKVSAFCGDLRTAISTSVKLTESGYKEGQTPSEPSQTVYEQILAKIKELEEQGVSEEMIANAIEKYLTEHPLRSGEIEIRNAGDYIQWKRQSETEWQNLVAVSDLTGADGKGISKAEINSNGELVLTYSDGTSVNVGVVKGANGSDYILTETDKTEIANIAIGNIADGDEVKY